MGKARDGGATATWERDLLITFCDLCVKEVELGNRPTTFFNKEGWEKILKNFIVITHREYNKIQLKNKWDQLKKDWKIWMELKRGSTGLGWDPKKKTIDAPDDWWTEKLKVVPHAKKFRYNGIDPELEDKLNIMFGGVVATGEHSWAPTEDVYHAASEQEIPPQRGFSNVMADESIQSVQEHGESSHSKCPASNSPKRITKKKKGGAAFLRREISELVSVCTSLKAGRTTAHTPTSLTEAIKVLDQIPEIIEDTNLYFHSIKVMQDAERREIFLAMMPDRRLLYLLHCFKTRDI